jgi:subtilase family serine protease
MVILRRAFLLPLFVVAAGCGSPVEPGASVTRIERESTLVSSAKPTTSRKPDLSVSDFTISPANPIAGDQVVFTATIQNVGQAATSNGVILGIGFYDSQNLLMASSNTYSTSLPAGGTVRLVTTNSWTALTGSQPVKAFVDDTNRIRESSENNNTLTKTVTVAPSTVAQPDLVITAVTHSPANPV